MFAALGKIRNFARRLLSGRPKNLQICVLVSWFIGRAADLSSLEIEIFNHLVVTFLKTNKEWTL